MPYIITIESTDPVPEDQIALMSQVLNVLGADPSVHYARWVTSTAYECEMGTTVDGKQLAMIRDKFSPPPAYSSRRDFFQIVKSVTVTTSYSAPDEMADHPDTVSGSPTILKADKGRIWPVTPLGSWRFPRGKDGKSRRWKELRMDLIYDKPPGQGLGTPVRSELEIRGHTG
ncbi:hypothetical protein L873DRAFT_1821726, partial [Choiromyces venosus 120613-1]